MHSLQHRGQEGAGIVSCEKEKFICIRKTGLVGDNFNNIEIIDKLKGRCAIGHVRYSTSGGSLEENIQPLFANLAAGGFACAHNGNLTNAEELKRDLQKKDLRHLNTESDSEVLLNVFAHELGKQREMYPSAEHIFKAVTKTHIRCEGAYAVLALITGHGILAFRDENGIRPLSIGIRKGK